MYSAPSYKHYRVLLVVIEEKQFYDKIEYVYCRAINKHNNYTWKSFLASDKKEEAEMIKGSLKNCMLKEIQKIVSKLSQTKVN